MVDNETPQEFTNIKVWSVPQYGDPPADVMLRHLTYGADIGVKETFFKLLGFDVKVLCCLSSS